MPFETGTQTCRPRRTRFIAKLPFALISAAFALRIGAQTCGANAQSPIATDRPQITNSSVVVPCGSLQLENGFEVTGSGGQQSPDFPETSIRLGVASRTELRISVPNYYRNAAGTSGSNGFGDLGLGFKQQLGPIAGFDVALIAAVSLPSGANSISSHGYDPTVQLPWSHSLTKAWTVAGQFGVTAPTQSGQRTVDGQASLYLDRQLSALWDAYVEYSGVFPQQGSLQHLIDFGTAYKLTPHQQLDLHCGAGLSSAAPDYVAGFGYSVRFQVFRSK